MEYGKLFWEGMTAGFTIGITAFWLGYVFGQLLHGIRKSGRT